MDTADTVLGIMSFYRVLSLHHSMKTLTLIIIFSLATEADGQETWSVTVPKELSVELSSDVTIQCKFTHPPAKSEDSVKVFWKIRGEKTPEINENDKYEFIYHPNNTWVKESFQNRTRFTGDVRKKNCSLKIQNIRESDANSLLYMRLANGFQNYSFSKDLVTIKIKDSPFQFTSPTVMITTEDTGQSTAIYVASTISLGVVLIAVTLGFIFFKHHKRHVTTITREPSDYYVNFSRAPKTNAEKTEISQKKEPIPLPPLNITQSGAPKTTIDEPVYGNVMPHNDVMDYSVDETDSVYANVDCSKP
ncbi:uncharacterized protein LOC124479635 isoform X2 [Hypomesus transpacificus]|uniref:uncharacterized protein LOC124479635 isoform X2 n=1 Tax=Hypomesus transpacificus TaxID=137520 RepID=UPI001F076C0C|nr:uncharacterized protein LOC124479635 isoform X2 [Hypomesus transpacificus]